MFPEGSSKSQTDTDGHQSSPWPPGTDRRRPLPLSGNVPAEASNPAKRPSLSPAPSSGRLSAHGGPGGPGASTAAAGAARHPRTSQGRSRESITLGPGALGPPQPPPEDIFEYLRRIPKEALFKSIFKDASVVRAVYRSLTDVEKVFVSRMLHLPHPIRWSPFVVWFGGDTRKAIEVLNNLRKRRILVLTSTSASDTSSSQVSASNQKKSGDGASDVGSQVSSVVTDRPRSVAAERGGGRVEARYSLHPVFEATFAEQMRRGDVGGSWSDSDDSGILIAASSAKGPAKHLPTAAELHNFATSQWDSLLRWMVDDVVTIQCRGQKDPGSVATAEEDERLFLAVGAHSGHTPPQTSEERQIRLTEGGKRVRAPSVDLQNVFKAKRYVNPEHGLPTNKPGVTTEALHWLLQDRRRQLNGILVAYLDLVDNLVAFSSSSSAMPQVPLSGISPSSLNPEAEHAQLIDCLVFLFTISQARVGQPCSAKALTQPQRRLLRVAYDLGLTWMHKVSSSKHFFTTPSCLLLLHSRDCVTVLQAIASGAAHGAGSSVSRQAPLGLPLDFYHDHCLVELRRQQQAEDALAIPSFPASTGAGVEAGIIVQSNFRVFAYTASPLQTSILSHLCELKVLTPAVVVATLTRDAIMSAYKAGTSAEQVIEFFSSNAHPALQKRHRNEGKPLLPEDVATQLRMWQGERKRLKVNRAVVFEFSKEEDLDIFPQAVARASRGWTLMHSDSPSNTNPRSAEFQAWKKGALELMRGGSDGWQGGGQGGSRCVSPVLAVHADFRAEITAFLREATLKHRQTQGGGGGRQSMV